MLFCDVVDQFHDQNGFTNASAAEQTGLAAFHVGFQEVDNLDAGFKHFQAGALILKLRSRAVNGPAFFCVNRTRFINRITNNVQNSAENFVANRGGDGRTGVNRFNTANHAVCRLHGNTANLIFPKVLCNLRRNGVPFMLKLNSIEDRGQPLIKFDIQYWTDNLNYFTFFHEDLLILCRFTGLPRR